jgi:hypothetical protein
MATYFATNFRQFTGDFVHTKQSSIVRDSNPAATPVGYGVNKLVTVSEDITAVRPSDSGNITLGNLYDYVDGASLANNTTVHFIAEMVTPDATGYDVVITAIGQETSAGYAGNEVNYRLSSAGDVVYFSYTILNDTEADNTPILVAGLAGGTGSAVIKWAVYYEA